MATKTIEQLERLFVIFFPTINPESFLDHSEKLERLYTFLFTPNTTILPSEVFDDYEYVLDLISLREIIEENEFKTLRQLNEFIEQNQEQSLEICKKELIARKVSLEPCKSSKPTHIGMTLPPDMVQLSEEVLKKIKAGGGGCACVPMVYDAASTAERESTYFSKREHPLESIHVSVTGFVIGNIRIGTEAPPGRSKRHLIMDCWQQLKNYFVTSPIVVGITERKIIKRM